MVAQVSPGSVAEDFGLQPGDVVLEANDRPLRDVVDFRYETAGGEFTLLVDRQGELILFDVGTEPGEPLGVEFEEPVFDGLRTCRNRCLFCFVHQMPPGYRRSLYLRDDDYRYSFLYGNFITLTNLTEEDLERVARQRLSPLYVSVHATEPDLREHLLGIRERPPLMEKLRRLATNRVRVHAQLVLVPGINDGSHLDRSLADLRSLGESLLSISVVPVGVTRLAPEGLRPYLPEEAAAVIAQVDRWRRAYAEEGNDARVYCSDEWFLLSDHAIPAARYYEEFPQVENGVGLVRLFLDSWRKSRRRVLAGPLPEEERVVVCGASMAPIWADLARQMIEAGARVTVRPVTNRAFGPTVTVSGLLTGADVVASLGDAPREVTVCLPRSMFNAEGTLTLDGWSPADLQTAIGRPVLVGSEAADVLCPLSPTGGGEQRGE